MGIPPYQTPVEYSRMKRRIQHYQDFLKLKGYEDIVDGITQWKRNGKIYTTSETFYKDVGCYPCLIKDGVSYGYYEVGRIEGYLDPWEQERLFLSNLGYEYKLPDACPKDYSEEYTWLKNHFKEHGWVPRWVKDGASFGHPELLVQLGFQYNGEPAFPILVEEEK